MQERIRVVIVGPGPDDADRLAESVARALRDAGVEVVYTDRQQATEQLVATVVQEDADAVGVVVPSGGDVAPVARLAASMRRRGIGDVVLFGGGGVAEDDVAELSESGVARVFPRDAAPSDVVDWLLERLRE